MKIVMVGEKKFKLPFLDAIPFDPEQDTSLGKAIEEAGEVYISIVCWKEESTSTTLFVVDGAHRIIHAARLGLVNVPIKMKSFDSEDEARDYCERINLERRHLTAAQLRLLRDSRIERITELRKKGESLRAIAAAENISETQVRRDLEDAGAPGGAPDGKVTGKDGKKYDAKTALCERCRRKGPIRDCQLCAKLRNKAKRKATKKSKPHDPLKDHFGNEIPQKRRSVWADQWIQTTYDFLTTFSENFRMQRLGEGMEKRKRFYPFFDVKEWSDGVGFVIQYLDDLILHLKDNRPAAVCPGCQGAGCGECRSSGFLPRGEYEKRK